MARPFKPLSVVRCTPEDGVTPELIELARKRVAPLLANWQLMDHDIKILVVSAYLQGCRDMAEVAVGWNPPGR